MDLNFRSLRADEIECRVAIVKEKGVSLLLYKDARCDMKLLDETVGQMNWKRSHQLIDGNLYCTIEIWDDEKQQWIGKQDVGTESYTEKEKGQASDSFKRSGFNWNIGRELYTAPFIWVPASKCTIRLNNKGIYVCDDRFDVKSIEIVNGCITSLEIVNEKTGNLVFAWSKNPAAKKSPESEMLEVGKKKIDAVKQKVLADKFAALNINAQEVIESYGAKTFADLTEDDNYDIIRRLVAAEAKMARKPTGKIGQQEIESLVAKVTESGVNIDKLMMLYKVSSFKDLTFKKYDNILANWEKIMESCK